MPKDKEEIDTQEDDLEVIVEGEDNAEPENKPDHDGTRTGELEGDREDKEPERNVQHHSEDTEDEDEDDAPEDVEVIRERRRKEKLERKERREKAIERDKVEMRFLRQRNEELERRMMAQEMRAHRQDHYTVEQQIAESENEARTAEAVLARAIAEANGDDAARALRIRDDALERIRYLTNQREHLKIQEEEAKKPKATVDPVVTSYANGWMRKNSWYDSRGRDADSRIVLTIDQGLVDEGFIPSTAEYWEELDRRVRRYLPHRFERDATVNHDEDESAPRGSKRGQSTRRSQEESYAEGDEPDHHAKPKKGPPIGQQREHAPASTRREVYISKERKEALIQAGVWDDPVLRKKYILQYQRWDKENAPR